MSFTERMQPAAHFELEVIKRLQLDGWQAFPFGQAQLTEECRRRLSRFEDGSRRPSLIRWMPDIITFRDLPSGRAMVALIDAKVCGSNTPNYSVEMSAVETSEIYTDKLYTPTFFVFDDWQVMTPREVRQRGRPGPTATKGSGTPYLLVEKRFGRPFAEIFPAVRVAA